MLRPNLKDIEKLDGSASHTVDASEICKLTSWGKGSLSHWLQGFSTIPGGWPWDFFHQEYCSYKYIDNHLSSLEISRENAPVEARETRI